MVQLNSYLKVVDNTGVGLVRCIKILGDSNRKHANMGDLLVVVIKNINPSFKKRLKKKIKVKEGMVCRALLVRTKKALFRSYGINFKFNENSVILINKKGKPLGKRVKGPILFELCLKYEFLGSITKEIL